MPSLRRTSSTPFVRASPYPTSLSLSASAQNAVAAAQRPRRVGSASDAGRRRVLADIEWWRVVDGQAADGRVALEDSQQPDQAQDASNVNAFAPEDLALPLYATTPSVGNVLSDSTSDGSLEALALSVPFAALSLASAGPATPPRARHARRDSAGSDASDASSVTSTPEASPLMHAFSDDAHSATHETTDGASEACVTFAPLLSSVATRPSASTPTPAPMARAASFGGFTSASHWADDRFGDVVF